MKAEAELPDHVRKEFQAMGAGAVAEKERAPLIAAGGDLVPSARLLNAQRLNHASSWPKTGFHVKC